MDKMDKASLKRRAIIAVGGRRRRCIRCGLLAARMYLHTRMCRVRVRVRSGIINKDCLFSLSLLFTHDGQTLFSFHTTC